MKNLTLEVNSNFTPSNDAIKVGNNVIMITPDINEDYWVLRVKLNKKGQAIVGFPKFGLIGIGFAQEEDGNTNLPSGCKAEEIYKHIRRNKGNKSITKEACIAAIKMIQNYVKESKMQ